MNYKKNAKKQIWDKLSLILICCIAGIIFVYITYQNKVSNIVKENKNLEELIQKSQEYNKSPEILNTVLENDDIKLQISSLEKENSNLKKEFDSIVSNKFDLNNTEWKGNFFFEGIDKGGFFETGHNAKGSASLKFSGNKGDLNFNWIDKYDQPSTLHEVYSILSTSTEDNMVILEDTSSQLLYTDEYYDRQYKIYMTINGDKLTGIITTNDDIWIRGILELTKIK